MLVRDGLVTLLRSPPSSASICLAFHFDLLHCYYCEDEVLEKIKQAIIKFDARIIRQSKEPVRRMVIQTSVIFLIKSKHSSLIVLAGRIERKEVEPSGHFVATIGGNSSRRTGPHY